METIDKRIKHLEEVLKAIKLCTQPIDGHTDPKSNQDCWNEVDDAIKSIKSGTKKLCFETWNTAIGSARGSGETYDKLSEKIGIKDFQYLKEDNKR